MKWNARGRVRVFGVIRVLDEGMLVRNMVCLHACANICC